MYIYINVYIHIHIERETVEAVRLLVRMRAERVAPWPLHDVAIINMILCMAYKWGVGGRRILRDGRAIALQ